MTIEETADILALCAGYDSRRVGEADILAWHRAIGDLLFEQAREAVFEHYTNSRERIMPADVRTRVKIMRARQIERAPIPAPSGDDPVRYRKELLTRIQAIADGKQVGLAITRGGNSRPAPAFLDARGDRNPARLDALQVRCPWEPCHAAVGRHCVNPDGGPLRSSPAHPGRIQAAKQQRGAA
ncbi:zinc finger domain-containing protein [Planobispora takensis]|uniref:DNA-binding phage zinc finger domain-containing protein n=1 Tax=Planobispora takensis TaxID=1367882 RepID=A0A8J3SSI9_9ACTN|nr:hypothetical protein [Planobispora takensis]GIH98106.1 hypothetical protein Pta02_01150 [Planobispora takensis]